MIIGIITAGASPRPTIYAMDAADLSFLAVGIYTSHRVKADSAQPIGQTKYRKVRLGIRGYTKYTQAKRSAHRKINVVMVGAIGLPILRIAAPIIWLIP